MFKRNHTLVLSSMLAWRLSILALTSKMLGICFLIFCILPKTMGKFGHDFVFIWRPNIDSVWNYTENQNLLSPSAGAWIAPLVVRTC